jgi:hypothetical protein
MQRRVANGCSLLADFARRLRLLLRRGRGLLDHLRDLLIAEVAAALRAPAPRSPSRSGHPSSSIARSDRGFSAVPARLWPSIERLGHALRAEAHLLAGAFHRPLHVVDERGSSVEIDVRSNRSRISSATTPNAFPRSPACAAMMAAFSASGFVWPAISSMTRTISPISSALRELAERALRLRHRILDAAHALDRYADRLTPRWRPA